MKMTTSTNSMVNIPMHGMSSDRHKKHEVPIKHIYRYYMGNSELIKRLLRMQGWCTKKFNESKNKWINMGINHNLAYEIWSRK